MDSLENFRIHQGGLISRVPRLVRDVTLREFVKYGGDVQECLKGIQKERLGGAAPAIDKSTRKRKWVESQEVEGKAGTSTANQGETSKGVKSGKCSFDSYEQPLIISISANDACGYTQEKGPSNTDQYSEITPSTHQDPGSSKSFSTMVEA